MRLVARPFDLDTDYPRVAHFLIDTYASFGWLRNWGIDRWEVNRYSTRWREELSGDREWTADTRIWETPSGGIVGVVHPEDPGSVFVEIHPDHRDLESEMFAWALSRHRRAHPHAPLVTFAATDDAHRIGVLADLGWCDGGPSGMTRRREIVGEPPPPRLPDGYRLATVDPTDEEDILRRAEVAASAFDHPRPMPDRVRSLLQAPRLEQDLHLVTVAPDGTYASYTIVWPDDANRYAVFEPVGTAVAHRRLGLAAAVMTEGLRRAARRGATHAYVGSEYGSSANLLYERMGFAETAVEHTWAAPL